MYATIADLRDEGVSVGAAGDARLTNLLSEATEQIDRVTGWFFEPRQHTFRVSGRGSATVELPVPPIALTHLEVEYEGASGDATGVFPFVPWSAIELSVDPGSVVVRGAPVGPDFDGARLTLRHGLRFPRGHDNIVISGLWGFTEDDGTLQGRTPPSIRRACVLLVLRTLAPLADDAAFEARSRWRVLEERTRDQSYRLEPSRPAVRPLSGDPEVDLLLSPYLRPSPMGAA